MLIQMLRIKFGLLQIGVDLWQLGSTALHLACLFSRKRAVEILLASGAKVDTQDNVRATESCRPYALLSPA